MICTPISSDADIAREVMENKREAKTVFGIDGVYLERSIERACHVEVQIIGDMHGNIVHVFEHTTVRSSVATSRLSSAHSV